MGSLSRKTSFSQIGGQSQSRVITELEVQKNSHAQLDRQIRDMGERHVSLMQKQEAELEQARKDLQKERQLVIQVQTELQQAQSQHRKERDRALASDAKVRDQGEDLEEER